MAKNPNKEEIAILKTYLSSLTARRLRYLCLGYTPGQFIFTNVSPDRFVGFRKADDTFTLVEFKDLQHPVWTILTKYLNEWIKCGVWFDSVVLVYNLGQVASLSELVFTTEDGLPITKPEEHQTGYMLKSVKTEQRIPVVTKLRSSEIEFLQTKSVDMCVLGRDNVDHTQKFDPQTFRTENDKQSANLFMVDLSWLAADGSKLRTAYLDGVSGPSLSEFYKRVLTEGYEFSVRARHLTTRAISLSYVFDSSQVSIISDQPANIFWLSKSQVKGELVDATGPGPRTNLATAGTTTPERPPAELGREDSDGQSDLDTFFIFDS